MDNIAGDCVLLETWGEALGEYFVYCLIAKFQTRLRINLFTKVKARFKLWEILYNADCLNFNLEKSRSLKRVKESEIVWNLFCAI